MADDKPAEVTEDKNAKVQAANEAEMQKWEGDFKEEDLQVKYGDEDEKDSNQSEQNNTSGAGAANSGSSSNEEDGTAGNKDVENEEVSELHAEPAPVVTVEDPGEFKPNDYSFKVTLAGGKKVTIKTPEDAEALADNPDNFETPKQLMDFINKQNKMNIGLDKDKSEYDKQKETFDAQSTTELQRRETVNNMVSEFNYLVSKKLIPAVPVEYQNSNWQDPEVAKQPGVKEQIELMDYITKENDVRAKAGIRPLISIVDAYNARRLEIGQIESANKEKEAGEARKNAGARVAGVSSSQQTPYVPKGIAVGRTNVFGRNQAVWDD